LHESSGEQHSAIFKPSHGRNLQFHLNGGGKKTSAKNNLQTKKISQLKTSTHEFIIIYLASIVQIGFAGFFTRVNGVLK